MIASEASEQINENQDSLNDENAIETLKQSVCLNSHQLLELTYNDQKFYQKIKELNHHGCIHIQKLQYTEALIYLTEAQKVLEYAASCGKTIERKLIITTLNNQASLYQKAWELEKAESYLEAIIYNISSYFDNSSDNQCADKTCQFTKNIMDRSSPQFQDYSMSLWRKKSLVIFYLQYCAINSQNKNNQRAFESAAKAVSLIKQISMDFYRYEQYLRQNKLTGEKTENEFDGVSQNNLFYQLGSFKEVDMKKMEFEKIYKKAVKYIAVYMRRLQMMKCEKSEKMERYKSCFENYSIGTIMQINPTKLEEQTDKVDLEQQMSMVQKNFKAIYLSVGHFILGTQGRFIAAQNYTLDQNERKKSPEYKESQIHHLCSIIILTKFLLCQSGYFDHIVNSFRNHYKLDILEDAIKFLESNDDLPYDIQNDSFFGCQFQKEEHPFQVKEIDQFQSDIKTIQQIPSIPRALTIQNGPLLDIQTQSSQEDNEAPVTPKQKNSRNTKNTKISKNTASSQNGPTKQINFSKEPITPTTTTKKKSHKKYSNNPLTKSQTRLQAQQSNRMTTSQHENKNLQRAINLLTSRQKQNKMRANQMNQNIKSSRSKRKSDEQFISSHKKLQLTSDKIGEKITEKIQSKKETIYIKRESDYGTTVTSRSKNKRIPTSDEGERKLARRKDSLAQLKKNKKVDNQYGIGANSKNIELNKNQFKSHKIHINIKDVKKSKNLKQTAQKPIKLTSPEVKLKKLKSPRLLKK